MKENYMGKNLDVGLLENIFEEVTFRLRPEAGRSSQEKNGVEYVLRLVGG